MIIGYHRRRNRNYPKPQKDGFDWILLGLMGLLIISVVVLVVFETLRLV